MSDLKIQSYRRQYEVVFAYLNTRLVNSLVKDTFLIIDSNVDKFYPEIAAYFNHDRIVVIEASEKTKTLTGCEEVLKLLVERGMKKNHKLLAVGGGVTQDITSFVASVLYRGVEWEFLPTTLLAQADSCIGSKTSINFANAKNLLGTFYPPSKIYCCLEFLETLSIDDVKSGIGEMLHYFLYADSPLAVEMMNNYSILLKNREGLEKYILASLEIKKEMIEKDEFDQTIRRVFNYGHTFGHAIEALSDYAVSHGQAVTRGMDMANFVALRRGLISQETYDELYKVLEKNLPSYQIDPKDLDAYFKLLSKDKKNIGKSVVCILPYGKGDLRVTPIKDLRTFKTQLAEYWRTRDD